MAGLAPPEMNAALRAAAGMEHSHAIALGGLNTDQEGIIKTFGESLQQKKAIEGFRTVATGLEAGWQGKANDIIKSDFDPNGNRTARGTEAARTTDVENRTKVYEEFLTKGYDGITDTAAKDTLRLQMELYIKSNPVLLEALKRPGSVDTIEPNTLIGLLRDRGFQAKLAEQLRGAFGVDFAQVEQEMLSARTERATLESKVNGLNTERTNLNDTLTKPLVPGTIAHREGLFLTDPAPTGLRQAATGETKDVVLNRLNVDTDVRAYHDDKALLAQKMEERKSLRGTLLTQIDGEITTLRTKIAATETDPTKKAKIDDQRELQDEWNKIKADRTAAETRRKEIDTELVPLNPQLAAARVKSNNLETARQKMSQDFADKIDKAMIRAGDEHLMVSFQGALNEFASKKQTYQEQQKTDKEKDDAEAKTKRDKEIEDRKKKIRKVLDTRWTESYTGRTWRGTIDPNPRFRPNRGQISDDLQTLMDQGPAGGPDFVARNVIATVRGLSTTARANLGITPQDYADITTDPVYKDYLTETLPREVLAAVTVGKVGVNERTLEALSLKAWGKEVMPQWVEESKNVKKLMQDAERNGLIKNGMPDFLNSHPKTKNILTLLALGLIGTAAAAAFLAASA